MPDSVVYLEQTPIFDWYVVRCGSIKRHVFNRHDSLCFCVYFKVCIYKVRFASLLYEKIKKKIVDTKSKTTPI